MKIALVFGTRPEIIKLSSIMRLLDASDLPHIIIHTNQHYSPELDTVFFEELSLPSPHYNLHTPPGTQLSQLTHMLGALEALLTKEKPDWVLVQGDTTSVLAGALAANKLGIRVGHIEAGLRSNDRTMPEEINRIVTDHISDILFPPSQACAETLRAESVSMPIHVVGNTAVDAVLEGVALAKTVSITEKFSVEEKQYLLATSHRPSNVDTKEALSELLDTFEAVSSHFGLPILFPIHPRTKNNLGKFSLMLPSGVTELPPLGYRDFLALQSHAKAVLTDSGGIQEECCVLGVPCVTLRENTERPEPVEVGANILVGRSGEKTVDAITALLSASKWENPFGDSTSGRQILALLDSNYEAWK